MPKEGEGQSQRVGEQVAQGMVRGNGRHNKRMEPTGLSARIRGSLGPAAGAVGSEVEPEPPGGSSAGR